MLVFEDVSERYSGGAIALHWLTAVLVLTINRRSGERSATFVPPVPAKA